MSPACKSEQFGRPQLKTMKHVPKQLATIEEPHTTRLCNILIDLVIIVYCCLLPCPFQRLGPSLQTKSIHNHVVTHAWWAAARARDLFWFVLLLLHASQLTRNRQFSTALHSNHSLNSSLQSLLASNPFSSTCLGALSGLP